MKTHLLHALVIAVLVGAGYAVYGIVNSKQEANTATTSHSTMNHDTSAMNDMSMSDMTDDLKGKTGDDFDKAFINMMIAHHEGAIEMANAAKANAKHTEIKAMADDIIGAQSREITQMKEWRTQWGY